MWIWVWAFLLKHHSFCTSKIIPLNVCHSNSLTHRLKVRAYPELDEGRRSSFKSIPCPAHSRIWIVVSHLGEAELGWWVCLDAIQWVHPLASVTALFQEPDVTTAVLPGTRSLFVSFLVQVGCIHPSAKNPRVKGSLCPGALGTLYSTLHEDSPRAEGPLVMGRNSTHVNSSHHAQLFCLAIEIDGSFSSC